MKKIIFFAPYLAWMQALLATLFSLYSSEIMHLTPCVLCWYQRIFMYPLVVILAIGIIKKDKTLPLYVLSLSSIGGLIAFFHYLLQRGIISEAVVPCQAGISCTTKYIEWFGFITIPFLSFVAFAVISILMYLSLKGKKS